MDGLINSWADSNQACSTFKSVAVTVQTEDGGPEIPVLTLDLRGQVKQGSVLIDKEVARSLYVKLDNGTTKAAGTQRRPSVTLAVRAIPVTLADVADTLAKVGKTALDTISSLPGGSALSSALPPGTTALASSILDVISVQANKYNNVSWERSVTASVESQAALPYHRATWILVPTPSNTAPPVANQPSAPKPVPLDDQGDVILPDLYACDQNAKTRGKLTHVCEKDSSGQLRLYAKYAWISITYDIGSEPASSIIRDPAATCDDLADPLKVKSALERAKAASLSVTHGQERDSWLKEYQAAASLFSAQSRESKIVGLEAWFNAGNGIVVVNNGGNTTYGAKPTAPTRTWSSLGESEAWIRGCVASLATDAALRPTLISAHKLWSVQNDIGASQTSAQLYEVVDAFDFAIPNNASQDDAASGALLRRRRESEEVLYKKAFSPLSTATTIRAAMLLYPKCQYCKLEALKMLETLPSAPPPATPVVADAGFETVLKSAGYDVAALEDYRQKSAALVFAVDARKPESVVAQAKKEKETAEKDALDSLEGKVGLPKKVAKDYLLP